MAFGGQEAAFGFEDGGCVGKSVTIEIKLGGD
jgi:hypothetical protein